MTNNSIAYIVMLESPSKPDEIKANDKVRNYFASCMAERQDQVRHASGMNCSIRYCLFVCIELPTNL
jgi:hypothetical protein